MRTADQILLERWANDRNAEAFYELVTRYGGAVYGTCLRILGNATQAEDAVQECFQALADAGARPGGYLGAWLHRVATNVALRQMRAETRRTRREQALAAQAETTVPVEWDDIYQYVDEEIAKLPQKYREPIVGHFLCGKTQQEIAGEMGVSRQTVSHRIEQGIAEVRQALLKRGVTVAGTALTLLLTANMAHAMPGNLAAKIGKLAMAWPSVQGAGTALGSTLLVKIALSATVVAVAAGAFVYPRITGSTLPAKSGAIRIAVSREPASRNAELPPPPAAEVQSAAQPAPKEEKKEQQQATAAPAVTRADIEREMTQKVSMEFKQINLDEILGFVSESWGINIVLDDSVIAKVPTGAGKADPFAAYVTDGKVSEFHTGGDEGSLASVLDQLLPPLNLTYSVEPGFVFVSSPELIAAMPKAAPEDLKRYDMQSVLDQPTKLAFDHVSMDDVLEFVAASSKEGTNFQVDARAVPSPKSDPSAAVSWKPGKGTVTCGRVPYINLKEIQLRDALRAILLPLDLDYSVEEGFVFVSSRQKIRNCIFASAPRASLLGNASCSMIFENAYLDTILAFLANNEDSKTSGILVDEVAVGSCDAQGKGGSVWDGVVVRMSLKNVSRTMALNALLRPRGLDFTEKDGAIYVTTPSRAQSETIDQSRFRSLRECGQAPKAQEDAVAASVREPVALNDIQGAPSGPRASLQVSGVTRWFKEGDAFEEYRVLSILPEEGVCVILNEKMQQQTRLSLSARTPEVDFSLAQASYSCEQFDAAYEQFSRYVELHSESANASDAQFWKAKCLVQLGKYESAAAEFEAFRQAFRESERMPYALREEASCRARLNQAEQATTLLHQIVDAYPDAPVAEQARRDLKKMQDK